MDLFVLFREKKRMLFVNGVLLLAALFLTVYTGRLIGRQYSQMEAERWSDGKIPYHQVSVFFDGSQSTDKNALSQVRNSIQKGLAEASYTDQSVGGRLWIDAYAAESETTVVKMTDMGSAMKDNVPVMGVGGDFFQFHPLNLLYGSAFPADDTNGDRIVIEENLAWNLFGSNDIAGKTVEISGKQFLIAGVYRAGDNKEEKDVWREPYLYMDFDAFQSIFEGEGLVSYEAVIPNPVRGFALKTLKSAFGEEESQYTSKEETVTFEDKVYVDNTDRFRQARLHKLLPAVPRLVMRTNQVFYPYWENTARMVEIKASALLWLREIFFCILLWYNRRALKIIIIKGINGFKKLPGICRRFLSGLLEKRRRKQVSHNDI